MAIIRWRPYREMLSLRNMMDRMMEESSAWDWSRDWPNMTSEMSVPIDMYETNGHLVVKSALPGVKSDDIDINIQDDRLVIKGEFKTDKEQDKGDIHYQERRYGRFHRSIPLPGSIDIEAVDAEFEDGILKITFPRPEESKTKRIEIKKS